MLLLLTMVYVIFLLTDVIPIAKNKQWKLLIIYTILITTAYTFTVLTELGVKIPSPADPLKQIITSVTGK